MRRRAAVGVLALLGAACVALLAYEVAAGAFDTRRSAIQPACTATPAIQGSGIDATIQRLVSAGLYKAACTLGTTREELVLSFAPNPKHPIRWDDATIQAAVRAGLVGAIADARDKGELPGFVADILGSLAEKAPVQWLIDGGRLLGGSLSGLGGLLNSLLGLAQ
jgi:hypothetical protein